MATRTTSNQLGSNPLPPPPAPPSPEELAELRRKGLIGRGDEGIPMIDFSPTPQPPKEVEGPAGKELGPVPRYELGSDIGGGWRPSKQLEEIYTRRMEAEGLDRSDAQSAVEAMISSRKPTPPERVKEIATETFRQLGGGRLRMITGAKDIYSQDLGDGDAALTFALPAGKGNRYDVTIPYNSKDDTYGLTITKRNRVVYDNEKGFDIGQVMDTIERETKVYLTLGRRD